MIQRELSDAPAAISLPQDSPVRERLAMAAVRVKALEASLGEVIRGKPEVIRLSLVCLLAKGHLLIEDVPGVGKTTLGHALARSLSCGFQRLQFTSDMLPSDVLGVTVYNSLTREFEFKRGPIFTNVLLADEINRSTPKTQSALLEAMNELQVTIDGQCYTLDPPFLVIATQNPVEHHGTYPLPESQLDRFLMRLRMGYPDAASERLILRQASNHSAELARPILSAGEVLELQELSESISVDDALVDYILAVAARTRVHASLALGVSPRGAQALFRAAQALALVEGRQYVVPDDIKRLVVPAFAHRVVVDTRVALSQRGPDTAGRILEEILKQVDVPL